MESPVGPVVGITVAIAIVLIAIRLLKREPRELSPLPPLGFTPRWYDLEQAPKGTVVISIENDDETPIEFVACVIRDYFNFDIEEAFEMMWHVHSEGAREIRAASQVDAERLVRQIHEEARSRGYPLECKITCRETRE